MRDEPGADRPAPGPPGPPGPPGRVSPLPRPLSPEPPPLPYPPPPLPYPPPTAAVAGHLPAFDATFVGPLLPPAPPAGPQPPPVRPVPEAILALPLETRPLIGRALDLLTRQDAGLRPASFYIGLMLLLTTWPLVALLGLQQVMSRPEGELLATFARMDGWVTLAALAAILGYVAAGVEARALATAVIGGRVEGRSLSLRQSIAIARRRFWPILGVQVLLGLVSNLAGLFVVWLVDRALGPVDAIDAGVSLLVGLVIAAPFVYAPAGIVLGEAGPLEAMRRSVGLARARKRLAAAVTLFASLSQLIVVLGIGAGFDIVVRLADGVGIAGSFPEPLVVPVSAALVFAIGTLLFLVEAIAAAPAVHAFAALTHYTHGLEVGRRSPLIGQRAWDPWITPGLAVVGGIALVALLGGVIAAG